MTLVTSYLELKQGIFSFHDFAKMSSSLFRGNISDSLVLRSQSIEFH